MDNTNHWQEINRYYKLWYDVTQLYVKWAKQHGTTYNSVVVMRTILENKDACTPKMICDRRGLPKQTVSTILRDFEKKGYIVLVGSETDGRSKMISLTPSGAAYGTAISDALYQQDVQVANIMGIDKFKELNEILAVYIKLYREIGNSGSEGKQGDGI